MKKSQFTEAQILNILKECWQECSRYREGAWLLKDDETLKSTFDRMNELNNF